MSSSSHRLVVLDDTDPSIAYSTGDAGWAIGTGDAEKDFGIYGLVYNNTLHEVNDTPGAYFIFPFSGEWELAGLNGILDTHDILKERTSRYMDR